MCSVDDDGGGPQPTRKGALCVGKKCMKCERRAVVTARTKDPFCKECFCAYFVHRFRATFGKARLFTTGEKVLLAFSGGLNSRVLLGLAEEGLKQGMHKRLRFDPTLVIIDEGAILDQPWSQRCQHMAECLTIAAATGFPTLFTHMEQVFGDCSIHSLEDLLSSLASDQLPQERSGTGGTGWTGEGGDRGGGGGGGGKSGGGRESGGEVCGGLSPGEESVQGDRRVVEAGEREGRECYPGLYVDITPNTVSGTRRQTEEEEEEEKEEGMENLFSVVEEEVGGDGVSRDAVRGGGDGVGGEGGRQGGDGGRNLEFGSEEVKEKGGGDMVRGDGGEREVVEVSALKDDIQRRLLVMGRAEELERQLGELFTSSSSTTAQENLLLSLRHQLLVEVARKQNCSKVLVGDTATRLAVRLLGNVAQGRGQTLPLDTAFVDERVKDVAIVRPLREFPANEVAMYAHLNELQSVTIPHLTTLAQEQTSIETLTESFVASLQAEFPSTVSTVFRTGDKLTVGGDDQMRLCSCALCQAPLGPPADPTVFTHLSPTEGHDRQFWDQLCYGCQLTMKDMKCGVSSLPSFVHSQIPDSRSEMHSKIKDCLLEDIS